MKLTDLGKIGRLESARQALEEAGSKGLLGRDVLKAGGVYKPNASGSNLQNFLCQLTTYCAIYEDDAGKRYYLNEKLDATFDRRIFTDDAFNSDYEPLPEPDENGYFEEEKR